MKIYKPVWALLLVSGLIAIFAGCKKDNNNRLNIIGSWVASYNYNDSLLVKQTYTFAADSSVKATRTMSNKTKGTLLGYQLLINGRFHLNGEHLTLYNLTALRYHSPNAPYAPLETLVADPADTLETYTIKINQTNNTFYFYYQCPPYALCVATLIYKKQ